MENKSKQVLCGGYCDSCKRQSKWSGFRKIHDDKDKVSIYSYTGENAEEVGNNVTVRAFLPNSLDPLQYETESENVFIIICVNNNNKEVEVEECLQDVGNVSCPRCQYLMMRSRNLLKNISVVEKKGIKAICDFCSLQRKALVPCEHCQKAIAKFKSDNKVKEDTTYPRKDEIQKQTKMRTSSLFNFKKLENIIEETKPYEKLEICSESEIGKIQSLLPIEKPLPFATEQLKSYDRAKISSDYPTRISQKLHSEDTLITTSLTKIADEKLPKSFQYYFPGKKEKERKIDYKTSQELIKSTLAKFEAEAEEKERLENEMKKIKLEKQLARKLEREKQEKIMKDLKSQQIQLSGSETKEDKKDAEEGERAKKSKKIGVTEEKISRDIEKVKSKTKGKEGEVDKKEEKEMRDGRKKEDEKEKGERMEKSEEVYEKIHDKDKEKESTHAEEEYKAGKDKITDKTHTKDDLSKGTIEKGKESKSSEKDLEKSKESKTSTTKITSQPKLPKVSSEKGKEPKEIQSQTKKRQEPMEKEMPTEKGKEPGEKESQTEKKEEPKGKESLTEKGDGLKGKESLSEKGKEPKAKETPPEKEKEPKGKETPTEKGKESKEKEKLLEKEKEPKGKETPTEKGKEPKGKETPLEKGKEPKGKETQTEKGKEPKGKETPTEKGKESRGKETPTEKGIESKGKETPLEKGKEPKGKETPTEKGKEPKGKETPAEKGKEPKGKETPTEKGKEPKGKETPTEKGKEPRERETPTEKGKEPREKETQTEKRKEPREKETQTEKGKEPKSQEPPTGKGKEAKGKETMAEKETQKGKEKELKGKEKQSEKESLKKTNAKEDGDHAKLLNDVLKLQEKEKNEGIKKSKELQGQLDLNKKKAEEALKSLAKTTNEPKALSKEAPVQKKEDKELKKEKGGKKPKASPEMSMREVKIQESGDDLILQMVKMHSERPVTIPKIPILAPPAPQQVKVKRIRKKPSVCSFRSDLELDAESLLRKTKKSEVPKIIYGEKIILKKNIPKTVASTVQPALFQTDATQENLDQYTESKSVITFGEPQTQETKGPVRYSLSNRKYIDNGWTVLPIEKIVRKVNIYRMSPAHPDYDWFERNKAKLPMWYDTQEKMADVTSDGRGRWYYRNGKVALEFYESEEINTQRRIVVYSSGCPDKRGCSHPITILGMFDLNGNGVVFDHHGKIRLKYNQNEGVVLDRGLGPVSRWLWHSLNEPPDLKQVMIDTQLNYKDPEIFALSRVYADQRQERQDDEDMINIEIDNFIKAKNNRTKEKRKFKPHQISMKALKINDQFSLKILNQKTIHLIFRDGQNFMKLNLGMALDHNAIMDSAMTEVGEVSLTMEKQPAISDSIEDLQKNLLNSRRLNRVRVERDLQLHPRSPAAIIDEMRAAASKPLRMPPLIDTSFRNTSKATLIQPTANTLFSNTRLI